MTSLALVEFINQHREQQAHEAGAAFPSKGYAALRHRDFAAKVQEVLGAGVCEKFRAPLVNEQNQQTYSIFVFPKREACLMAMSYSYELQAKVFDRMTELEQAAAPRVPQTMAQALRLAAEQAELIEQQQAEIAAAAPKVEFVNRYVESTGSKGFREVCKLLGAKENAFREFLAEKKIMYRLHGALTPYADHLDAGRFEVKAGTSEHNGHAYNAARFTPKGIAWVAGQWAAHKLEGGAA